MTSVTGTPVSSRRVMITPGSRPGSACSIRAAAAAEWGVAAEVPPKLLVYQPPIVVVRFLHDGAMTFSIGLLLPKQATLSAAVVASLHTEK